MSKTKKKVAAKTVSQRVASEKADKREAFKTPPQPNKAGLEAEKEAAALAKKVAGAKFRPCVAKVNIPARNISNQEKCLFLEDDGLFYVKKDAEAALPTRFNRKLFNRYFTVK
jgi:hypothetical protein